MTTLRISGSCWVSHPSLSTCYLPYDEGLRGQRPSRACTKSASEPIYVQVDKGHQTLATFLL